MTRNVFWTSICPRVCSISAQLCYEMCTCCENSTLSIAPLRRLCTSPSHLLCPTSRLVSSLPTPTFKANSRKRITTNSSTPSTASTNSRLDLLSANPSSSLSCPSIKYPMPTLIARYAPQGASRSCLLLILVFTLCPSGRRRGGSRYSHLLHGQGRDHHHCSATQGRCTTSDRTSYTFRAAAVAPQPAVSALTAFSASVAY